MSLFAFVLSPPLRSQLLELVQGAFVILVAISFVYVAFYATRQFQNGKLVSNAHAPLPIEMPPLAGWLFISSVLLLVFLEPPLYMMLVMIVTVGVLAENQRTAAQQFGFSRLPPLRTVTASLLTYGAVMLVEAPLSQGSNTMLDMLRIAHPEQQTVETFRQYDSISDIVNFLFFAVLVAPLIEELFFRGFLLVLLKKYMSTWTAIILSGAIFAAVHMNVNAFLPLWFLGFALGLAYENTGSLLVPIGVHMCFNLATGLSLQLDKGSY